MNINTYVLGHKPFLAKDYEILRIVVCVQLDVALGLFDAKREYPMSRDLLSTEDFTSDQIENALDQLIEWFPEEAENINLNKEELVSLIETDTIPTPGSYILSIEYAITDENGPNNLQLFELPSLTPCEEACGMVAFDVVMFVFGLFGLHISNQERLTRALLRELGPDTLRGLARAIHNFSAADGALAKAKALFSVLGGI